MRFLQNIARMYRLDSFPLGQVEESSLELDAKQIHMCTNYRSDGSLLL